MSALIIREFESGKEVDRFDTTGDTERQIDRLERGILINLDRDNFYVDQEN